MNYKNVSFIEELKNCTILMKDENIILFYNYKI